MRQNNSLDSACISLSQRYVCIDVHSRVVAPETLVLLAQGIVQGRSRSLAPDTSSLYRSIGLPAVTTTIRAHLKHTGGNEGSYRRPRGRSFHVPVGF